MLIRQEKIRLLSLCLVLSIVAHCLALSAVRLLGSYHLGAAVGEAPVMVDLGDLRNAPPAQAKAAAPKADTEAKRKGGSKESPPATEPAAQQKAASPAPPETERRETKPAANTEAAPPAEPHEMAEKAQSAPVTAHTTAPPPAPTAAEPPKAAATSARPSAAATSTTGTSQRRDYLFAKGEKLTYLVSMMGMPIGTAELEAKNDERGTTITLRVRSNAAISGIYPVDDVVETQHIDGRYLMTKIRQHEGSFKSDEYFSINLVQKRVTYADNLHYRNLRMSVPTDDVLDTLSGIYSLRSRQLQVGRTETLHIFDSEKYAEVPVEILRREEMRLPNLTTVDALVIRPLQKTAGIFRRTGDILIWMTDDANKVPVKIVTQIALGKVTAELLSAESDSRGQDNQAKTK